MMPANAVRRTLAANDREDALVAWAEETDLNRVEMRDTKVGIICAGALYVHVRVAMPDASVLKLGVTWPPRPKSLQRLPRSMTRSTWSRRPARTSRRVRALGIDAAEPPAGRLPRLGEVTPAHIRAAFGVGGACAPRAGRGSNT